MFVNLTQTKLVLAVFAGAAFAVAISIYYLGPKFGRYFAERRGNKEKKLVNRKGHSPSISPNKPAKREKYKGSVKRGGLNARVT